MNEPFCAVLLGWGNARPSQLAAYDRLYRSLGATTHSVVADTRAGLVDARAYARTLEPTCRIVCPDLVGRGQSDWLADKSQYAYPQYLADMTVVIARASGGPSYPSTIDWVGTSIGGLIGMFIAAQPGNPIRRLVMNDIGPLVPRAALERIGSYLGKVGEFASFEDAERYIRTVSAPFGPLTDAEWRFSGDDLASVI